MNYLLLVVLSLIATIVGDVLSEEVSLLSIQKGELECISEKSITPEILATFKKGIYPDPKDTLNCYTECLFQKLGFLNNSILQIDVIKAYARLKGGEPYDKIVDVCTAINSTTDMCELSLLMYKCYISEVSKLNDAASGVATAAAVAAPAEAAPAVAAPEVTALEVAAPAVAAPAVAAPAVAEPAIAAPEIAAPAIAAPAIAAPVAAAPAVAPLADTPAMAAVPTAPPVMEVTSANPPVKAAAPANAVAPTSTDSSEAAAQFAAALAQFFVPAPPPARI